MSTRPDMANAVCQLSHLMSAPPEHFDIILRHVFRYLNGTDGAKLTYKRDGDNMNDDQKSFQSGTPLTSSVPPKPVSPW